MPFVLIRHADPDRDGPACAAIYAPYVTDSVISLEEVAPTPEQFTERIRQIGAAYPYLVAVDDDGAVAGYAHGGRHREREGYRWTADVTVYLGRRHHRRRIGTRLYRVLFELLTRQGYWTVCAGITVPNDASLGLHTSVGFEPVGVYRRVAYKHGAWRDVVWLECPLRSDADFALAEQPPEPGPPVRLDAD